MSTHAPELTPGQENRLKLACKDADEARRDALKVTRNPVEAFIVWRKIAEAGLPGMSKKGVYTPRYNPQ